MFRIETAQPLAGYRLKVRFNDGLEGIYPVEPKRRGGVFLKLLEAKTFNAVTINPDFGCVEWPGGIDLCPDTMHQAMTGSAAEVELHSPMALREEIGTKTKIKTAAVRWLASKFGNTGNTVCASKLYIPKKSWTRRSAWWFEIPQRTIEAPKSDEIDLLCEVAPGAGKFHHLKVSVEFLRKELPKLCVRKNGRVSLFLSAEPDEMFVEQRGSGKISFCHFLKT